MQEETKEIRTKVVLEGAEEYIQKVNYIKEAMIADKRVAEEFNAAAQTVQDAQEECREKEGQKVYYLCDGSACVGGKDCYVNGGECRRTSDITHAKNFRSGLGLPEGDFCEKDPEALDEAIAVLEEDILKRVNFYKNISGSDMTVEKEVAWLRGLAEVKQRKSFGAELHVDGLQVIERQRTKKWGGT